MSGYEVFDLFLHSIALIISSVAMIITYMAIMSARGDNFLTATLQITNSFFSRVDQMQSNYDNRARGTKLFVEYEQDLHKIIHSWPDQENYHMLMHLRYGEEYVRNLVFREKGTDKRVKKYVELNGAELVHYIEFFNGFIPTVERKLNAKQLELFRSLIRSSVTMSEWKFLMLFATGTNNSILLKALTTLFPDSDLR